jgi:hypothetical protein
MGKHLAITFAIAVVFYAVAFSWVEHRRVVKGPWEIVFTADASGHPALQISQPTLGISEKLLFPGDNAGRSNLSQLVKFSAPTTNLPFGENIFQDALYLPGTVTLRLCGHRIEILPRTLIVDKIEHPWQPGAEMVIQNR